MALRGAGARQLERDAGVDLALEVAHAQAGEHPLHCIHDDRAGMPDRVELRGVLALAQAHHERAGVAQLTAGRLQPAGAGELQVVLLDAYRARVAQHAAQLREPV